MEQYIPGFADITYGVVLSLIGLFITNYFNNRRIRKQKKTDIITEYLIKSYLLLTDKVSNRDMDEETERKLEKLVSEIQLFGSKKQIKLMHSMVEEIVSNENGKFDIGSLTKSLRDNLRKEFGLEKIEGGVRWLRSGE